MRTARCGLAAIAGALVCFLLTALMGPSAEEPALPGAGPPFALRLNPSPSLSIAVVAAGVLLGTAGLGLCLLAMRRGWTCSPKALLITGLVLTGCFALLPPVGSADHLNYAAYGRMVVLHQSPYVGHASEFPHDPVIRAVQEWGGVPSVYGPFATAQQAFASWIGGTSVRLTVFVLALTNALAFAAAGLLLYVRAADRAAKTRAMLLWTVNPLLLFHLVAGAHNDAISVALAVAALTVLTTGRPALWRVLVAGLLTGSAAATKLPSALVGAGAAWSLRRRPWWLAALVAGAVVTVVGAFLITGSEALHPLTNAAKMVAHSSPWHLFDEQFRHQRTLIQRLSALLALGLFALLLRGLPAGRDPARVAAALAIAWLFATQYSLPWYDALGWAMLAMLAASRVDWLLLVHTLLMSLAYLPARQAAVIGLPDHLLFLERTVRPTVIPWALVVLLAATAVVCLWRRGAPAAEPTAPRPGTAVPEP